jgi:hypothetical protein
MALIMIFYCSLDKSLVEKLEKNLELWRQGWCRCKIYTEKIFKHDLFNQ